MKKKFLPSFEPARLVRGTSRWYISFYAVNDLTKRREKFKLTFNLNRITDLRLRARVGEDLAQKITWWMEQGKPISRFDPEKVRLMELTIQQEMNRKPLMDAIDAVLDVHAQILRSESMRSYRGVCEKFRQFLHARKWEKLLCSELTKAHAAAYLDHCLTERRLSARTYNNQIIHLRTIINKLIHRGYLQENPFSNLPLLRPMKKQRRVFTHFEARAVAKYIQATDRLLFYALLLEYTGYIRPAELRRLKFENIDLKAGIIRLGDTQTKDKEERFVTIPSDFLQHFDVQFFAAYPAKWFVFGQNMAPHPDKPCGISTMYNKHLRALKELQRRGELADITGLTWYSWKDTGITDALEDLPILAVKDQAGHSDVKMTLRYRQAEKVNRSMKGFKNKLF